MRGHRALSTFAAVSALAACAYPQPPDLCDGPCAIFALDRPVAAPGYIITLEGSFERDARVLFPGVPEGVALTSYGSHRAKVKVPDNATSGGIQVQGRPNYSESVPLRVVTFRPELQPFRTTYEQTDVGRFLGGPAIFARTNGAAVVAGGRVYLIGGAGTAGLSKSVDSMLVNADDTLGDVAASVTTLETARARHVAIAIGPYVYAIGGTTASGATATVEGATLDASGALGAFSVMPDVELTVPREGLAAAVIGNYVYVIGGKNEQGELATLERAQISEAGLLGTFEPISGIELLTPRSGHSLAVVGNSLYVIGGKSGGALLDTIERLELSDDAYLSAPTVAGRLVTARTDHTSVLVGDSVYVLGGTDASGATGAVERLAGTDTLTATAIGPAFPRTGAMVASAGNHVYLLGGSNDGGPIDIFERASIVGAPTTQAGDVVKLDNFAAQSDTLGFARSYPSTLVLGNTLYVIGGANDSGPLASIEKASINADGTLGAFEGAAVHLNLARMGHASFVYNNTFCVLGGRTSADFSTSTSTAECANVGPDGALGPFTLTSSPAFSLDVPRSYFVAAVIQRALYIIGGVTNSPSPPPLTFVSASESIKATLLDEGFGSIPPFEPRPGLGSGRGFHSLLVLPSRAYVLMGGGASLSTGEAAVIMADTTGWAWGPANNNPSNRQGSTLVAVSNVVFAIGGSNGASAPSERSMVSSTQLLGPFQGAGAMLATPRYGHRLVTLDNRIYAIGGVSASTDFPIASIESTTIH